MPFVLLMLGVVTLAVALGSKKSGDAPAPGKGRTYTLDASMPPALRDQVLAALASERNPAVLDTFGNALQFQYPLAAAALRQRANELRALGGPSVPPALPLPSPAPIPVPVPVAPAPAPAPLPVPVVPPFPAPVPIPVPPSIPVPPPAVLPPAVPALPMGLDPGMPPEIAQAVTTALATETDPEKLRAFAATLSPRFPIAAGLLIAKANALALVQPRPSVTPPAPNAPPLPIPVGPPSVSNPLFATVTTNDPPPQGDLKVFDAMNGKQIGGAEKNGTVGVITWNADGQNQWAKIAWTGGSRWKAVTGFVHQAFLRPSASLPALPPSLQGPQLIMSASQPFPAAAAPATYVVKSGDFPIKIAQKLTGDGSRWKELIAANPTKKVAPNGTFAQLVPGEILNLPASWASKGVTNAAHA
jgi:nucleoid-associated protein YgaU